MHFIEILEARIAPANITATVVGHLLLIVGNDTANNITIDGVASDDMKFSVTSSTDAINGALGFTTPTEVTDISIKLLGGDDHVSFSNAVRATHLTGGLKIDGGAGANGVSGTDLSVDKSISIINGAHAAGIDTVSIQNLTTGGSVTIKNGDGDTYTTIARMSAGLSTIAGSLSITNGRGVDQTTLEDTSVGHNVTIKNGHGRTGGVASYTRIYNNRNATFNSVIGGNVSVSYVDGTVDSDSICDATVLGNVTLDHGSGTATINIDGFQTTLPVVIRGNLTLKGTGANTVTIGTQFHRTGLIVGKALSITTGGSADTLTFNKLQAGGATRLQLGDGANFVNIDDSTFVGAFTLTLGRDIDDVRIDTTTGTSLPTIFERPVLIMLGAGNDVVTLGGIADAGQELIADAPFVVHYMSGSDSLTQATSHELFPLGGFVQFIR